MKVKLMRSKEATIPEYQTDGAAGFDLHSVNDYTLKPGQIILVKTGLNAALPEGTELQIRSRSGLALKHGIVVLNSPGTIDCDYRGEIGVIMINHSDKTYKIKKNDRVAQGVLAKYFHADFVEVKDLDSTNRTGGFGSTGNE